MVENIDHNHRKNTLVTGCAGTGKTTRVILPKIQECLANGESVIITDPRGELLKTTAEAFRKKGYLVRRFDLSKPDKSDSWACLSDLFAEEGTLDETRLTFFAQKIITASYPVYKEDRYIHLTCAMRALLKAGIVFATGETAKEFAEKQDQSLDALINVFSAETTLDDFTAKIEKNGNAKAIQYLSEFKGYSDEAQSNFFATVSQCLANYKAFAKVTGKAGIDLSLPAREKAAYYVNMPDAYACPLASMFIQMAYAKLAEEADKSENGRCVIPVNMILDEFPILGRLQDLQHILNTAKARGIYTTIVVQDISQIYAIYGRDAGTVIIAVCDNVIDTNIEATCRHLFETVSAKAGEDPTFTDAESELLKALLYASRVYACKSMPAGYTNHLLLKEARDIIAAALKTKSPEDYLAGYVAENVQAEEHLSIYKASACNLRITFIRGLKARLDKYLDE